MGKNKQGKLNLDGIIKVLESHNITVDDLKKINDLQKIRQNNLDILTLLNKLPSAFKSKKLSYESISEVQKIILKNLKNKKKYLPKYKKYVILIRYQMDIVVA